MNLSDIARGRRIVASAAALGLLVTVATSDPLLAQNPSSGAIPRSVTAPAEQLGKAFAAVAAHVKPAVVSVYSEKMVSPQQPEFPFPFGEEPFGRQAPQPKSPGPRGERKVPQRGMGSGMILDKQGHILTNYHVVGEVDEIKVQLADRRSFEARIIGADPKTDVAVIQITGKLPDDLPTVELGDSDALEDGNVVMAVGAPFGLTQTVTTGIISAKGRSDVGIAAYEDFLQTDAPINPGNSGGPLVNMRGEVIGMNSAIATGGGPFGGSGQFAGVGFAIPSNMIKSMLPTLVKGGQIIRGMLGIIIQDLTKELAEQFRLPNTEGALVSQVNKDSPAAKADVKVGDVVVRFDGKKVRDTRQLRNLVAATAPGTSVKLDVIRDGKEQTLTATIGKMPTEPLVAAEEPVKPGDRLAALGLSVQTLTPELAQQLDLQGEKGVIISGVEEGSPAADADLRPGDVIVEAERKPVSNVAELRNAVGKAKNRVLLLVKRQGGSLYVVVTLR
ncbi:MAG TPA: DegQ family serine endoprotease [Burkholderiales bacterium]|nr:DegQ family serine endoprotease [Burkholderiales bacterium]